MFLSQWEVFISLGAIVLELVALVFSFRVSFAIWILLWAKSTRRSAEVLQRVISLWIRRWRNGGSFRVHVVVGAMAVGMPDKVYRTPVAMGVCEILSETVQTG